ncbi:MAG TPA: DUF58 domain-containing protein [Fusibacter sp.]|nr:DUF58 domain-containing protein [Fusibacter sp.]
MTKGFKRTLYILMAFLLVVAVLSGGKTLYYFLFTTGIVWLSMGLILRHNERNLYILYYASENLVHSGDAINIDYKISNTSFVPILHAIIDFKLDKRMNTESSLREIAYFGNFDKINFSKDIICKYRGYYKVGQVKVQIYDPLMLDNRIIDFNKEIDITVYPKVVKLKEKLLQSQDFYGTLKSNMRTLEDRTNLINIRPYVQGDQLKNIHWKLSAKKEDLQTKEFEQTVSTKLVVFVNGSKEPIVNLDEEERMVSFAVSLIKEMLDDAIQIKVMLNNGFATILEGNKSADFQSFLEAFTSFECSCDTPFANYVNAQISEAIIEQSGVQNTRVLIMQNVTREFIDTLEPRGQVLDIFTFTPKSVEMRELLSTYYDPSIRYHYIDQIMDVTYGQ